MPAESVSAPIGPAGVVVVTIDVASYPMVGQHLREQLSGRNARKWGRIYIDPDKAECKRRRDDALAAFRGLYKGEVGNNCDECPGAMFYWDGPAYPAHVQPLCAYMYGWLLRGKGFVMVLVSWSAAAMYSACM